MLKHVTSPAGVRPVLLGAPYFVFYNNTTSPEGAVQHSGDNRTGSAEIDDETIFVDLTNMPEEVSEVSFVVTIHDAETRRQNFVQVSRAYIRLIDEDKFNDLFGKTAGTEADERASPVKK